MLSHLKGRTLGALIQKYCIFELDKSVEEREWIIKKLGEKKGEKVAKMKFCKFSCIVFIKVYN